jgi:hypothetical protein
MYLRSILLPLAVATATLALSPAGAALTHAYEFDTDLSDSVPGGTALSESFRAPATGSVAAGAYSFEQGAGLTLANQLPGGTYTIDIAASFRKVGGYNKLVSFNDLADDKGFYILDGKLNFYNFTLGSDTIGAGDAFTARLTRDGTSGLITGYLNGVEQWSFDDTGDLFGANSNLWFLRDDTAQNSEDSAGTADYIRLYDTVEGTRSAVPEPATWAMMVGGFGLIGGAMRRRQRGAFAV